jgi:acyl-coenzyme A thioesterase PaaI-like protein
MLRILSKYIPSHILGTFTIRLFGLTKIPLLLYVRPSVVALSNERAVIKIPLRRRTRNHLRSMYFGALAIGADCAGGIMAMQEIQKSPHRISLIFKTLTAEFVKRAEGDVFFTCSEGKDIAALVAAAEQSPDRIEMPVHVTATVPSRLGDEPVAAFTLLLSLKRQS